MNFIKKNWGFLVIAVISLVILGFFLTMCIKSGGELSRAEEQAHKLEKELAGIGSKNLKLSQENIDIATQNAAKVAERLKEMKKELGDNFRVKSEAPAVAMDGLMKLKRELAALEHYAEEHEMEIPGDGQFTFDNITRATQLPSENDLPSIFHSLAIVTKVVHVAGDTGVKNITGLTRLLGLATKEEKFYTYTPIQIEISASPELAQKFINNMANQKDALFILRDLSVDAPDAITELGNSLNLGKAQSNRDGGIGERRSSRRTGMNPAIRRGGAPEEMEDGPGMSRRSSRTPRKANRQGGEGETGTKSGDDSVLVDVPIKRQDYLVFEDKETLWTLRYDLIEFPEVKPEGEGEQEAN